ncbi:MAG: hypothetical protein A2X40_05165 [Elusimicrobia bacterium GWC2_65_9]|nr:MAG: hypothetical protein A2X40_05165 [Elusimicrobia bacterium GWC2_65_9]
MIWRHWSKHVLILSLTFIALLFLFSSGYAYLKFRDDLIHAQLANQQKMTRIVNQSLNLYFDKLRFAVEVTVLQTAFRPDVNRGEDAIRYEQPRVAISKTSLAFQGIAKVLENPRKAVDPADSLKRLRNWQIYKALPEVDLRGEIIARLRRVLARNILRTFKDVHYVFEMDINGDLVFLEPFEIQKNISSFNYEFRDYLQLVKACRSSVIVEFKRLVSNLVNNAVEAFGDGHGSVNIGLASSGGCALVSVQDNGKGIPPDVLAKLGRRGETHGKAGGSGLGLYHAQTSAESWGGSLEIASEVGKGTTTTVILPLSPAPEWFVPELRLTPGKVVVILDDDASIHQVWQGRLDALKAGGRGVEVVHVSTPDETRGWVKGEGAKARQALYLFDYELLGYHETGLSLAEELALGDRVVLVTSRYDEPKVLEGCRRLKARLIPKGLAGSVPMHMAAAVETPERERLDAVLIDDDALARMNWKMAAKRVGKSFKAYSDAASFLAELDAGAISTDTPIYIDSNLADGVKGEDVAREISRRGFAEIRLATGHEPSSFPVMPHIREVVGKTPPWDAV